MKREFRISRSSFIRSISVLLQQKCFTMTLFSRLESSNAQVGREFINGPENRDTIPGWIIPKSLKILLDSSVLNTQHLRGTYQR